MQIWYSIFAGIIQGLTEFLPISSSGHLVLLHDLLGFQLPDDIAFDAILHWGTLAALVIFFWPDVIRYLKAFFKSFVAWNIATDTDQRLAWYLFVATIPAGIIGYLFEDYINNLFRHPVWVAVWFIVFGLILYWADHYFAQRKTMPELTFTGALLIGCSQALALLPGVSRSGITIIAGLSQNLKREDAVRFTFLLSMPIIFAAGAKKLLDVVRSPGLVQAEGLPLLFGFVAAAVVGYLSIKFLLRYIQRHSLNLFVYYRIAVGLLILLLYFFTR